MKKLYALLLLSLSAAFVFAQCNGRYQTEIFSSITTTTVNYSDVYNDNEHKIDIYMPDGDTATNRPVILYMHGGSFYGGDKTLTDCVDFCKSMAKRGYVTASLNYRLSNITTFLFSQEEQYRTVLKAVADAKAAIRFFRKDFANGNTYGIDPNTIFVGGYSAGGVIAIHLAYIDNISDLPTSPINVQNLVSAIGGDLEGDAGNNGYISEIQGVISFAGGINNVDWIDGNDEPLVSVQGTADVTVNYNCGPGTNNPLVLDLCGSGEMHPRADNVGLLNDRLIFNGTDHLWAAYGNTNLKFVQALDFTSNFLYPLLPCNNTTTGINEFSTKKKLIKAVDILGRESKLKNNIPRFYIYDDGSVKKKIVIK
ncbi:alpha/beta hydrolase [Flavobacteriales bacterium]|nr:alpha/beta hydrolase [Flavobacteriales bacterium]